MKLKDKVAIVTGASRGIGRAIALAFAREGANVVINFRTRDDLAEEVVSKIKKLGQKALKVQADVRNLEEVNEMVELVIKEFGRIDILVNNAGIIRDKTLRKMTKDDWDDVIQTNLTGIFNCCKAVWESMIKAGGGCIINISSVVGEMGNFGQTNYAASKAGVIGFTKSLAKEGARKGIRVNAIAPGFIETDMITSVPEEIKKKLLKQIPLGRFGKPEEVAKLAVFLASEDASYITGQTININGGLYG